MRTSRLIVNILGAPIVFAFLVGIAILLVKSRKGPPLFPPKDIVVNVATMDSVAQTVTPRIQTFGTTQAYLSAALSAQVGGEILEISPSFEAGNPVTKDEWLVRINPADYQATLANRQAALATARQTLAQEEIRSKLAEEDWLAAGRELANASDLTLRKPQLRAALAAVASAQAALDQANIDLERTTLRAPFDAIVSNRSASPGNVLTRGSPIGTLISKERIQVRLPITPSQAARIKLPRGKNATPLQATLTTPSLPGESWTASVNRVEPAVDPKNQTLYLVGDIESPFEDPDAFLPVGAFVDAEITGQPIEGVHPLPEAAIVEDSFVWAVSPENTLIKQPISIVFSQSGKILASIENPVVEPPLQVLTLPLASFSEGQKVAAVKQPSER